jgi:hypothetical protein
MESFFGFHSYRIEMQPAADALYFIVHIAILTFSILQFKKMTGPKINLKQLIIGCLGVTLVTIIVTPFLYFVYYGLINTTYFNEMIERSSKMGGFSSIQEASAYFNLSAYIRRGVIGILVLNILAGGIICWYLNYKVNKRYSNENKEG